MAYSFGTRLISAIQRRLAKPVQKTYEQWKARVSTREPIVSFIVQSHNRSSNVELIVSKLRTYLGKAEIVVIDDGSDPSHASRLSRFLDRPTEFLIRANDLYEVIMYDRALSFVRGEFAVLLQDDDDFETLDWVDKGIQYFERFHDLAILGGRNGFKFLPIEKTSERQTRRIRIGRRRRATKKFL